MAPWARKLNPHERRTNVVSPEKLRIDPEQAIKEAIWVLIMNNCFPKERARDNTYSGWERRTKIQDVTVQTFYVSYPPGLQAEMGGLSGEDIALQIIEKMVSDPNATFEPYLISKIGRSVWETAKKDDEQNQDFNARISAASDIRLVEVIIYMDQQAARNRNVYIVSCYSLAVEVTRLRMLRGKEPNVIAVINVDGKGYVNPHLREYQQITSSQRRSRNRPIYILEGRNSHEFIIGPHHYDDIEVPGMRDDEWFALTIGSTQDFNVTVQLQDSSGKTIPPEIRMGIRRWALRNDGGGDEWNCTLSFTNLPMQSLSFFQDAPEVPPSVLLVGRILPRSTADRSYQPAFLKQNVPAISATAITSGITIEEDVYLYSTMPNNEVYLYDEKGSKNIIVTDANNNVVPLRPEGYKLTDRSKVILGGINYTWNAYMPGSVALPAEVIGLLEYNNKDRREIMEAPIDLENDPGQWMLGGWRQRGSSALRFGCVPLFLNNPDRYLGGKGNLILKYDNRDIQSRPQFRLLLKKFDNELAFIIKTARDPNWRNIGWPQFGNDELLEVSNVVVVGERNDLIFGTCYYRIQTSTTLSG